MPIHLDRTITQQFNEAISREWLETNGIGGWASSTLCGAHTRRYHGLLVAALQPPVGRVVLLSRLDEALLIAGRRYDLGCTIRSGFVHPRGYAFLEHFTRDLFPVFLYEAAGIRVRKTVVCLHGENTALLRYEILSTPAAFVLEFRPLVAGRDLHSLVRVNGAIDTTASFHGDVLCVHPYSGLPDLFIRIPGADFDLRPEWCPCHEYPAERERGMDYQEDLFCYGVLNVRVKEGDAVLVVISTRNPLGRDAFGLLEGEKRRRSGLIAGLDGRDDLAATLCLAADQFVVERGKDLRSVIAGYHWFTDWARDAMISLPGLTLVTGRYGEAKKILTAFAENVCQGLVPNSFPDTGGAPGYNTADASLWFFVAIFRYLHYSGDTDFVRLTMLPMLSDIIGWHIRGTRYNIHMDKDGLLYAGEQGVQLTWMDAKCGDWVVTPRQGKAVEINALWYNALRIYASLCARFGRKTDAASFEDRAKGVRKRFNALFWNEDRCCLYDVVDGERRDAAIRPNQIFALSLPFPLVSQKRASAVLEVIEHHLLTPCGLRSLAPEDPGYHPRYEGDQRTRDAAYHQGTVWPWLLGPFISALIRFEGAAGRDRARAIINTMSSHMEEAGIGTISEIFDGDPPHTPRGCIAQAWSVAEVLRAYMEDMPDIKGSALRTG